MKHQSTKHRIAAALTAAILLAATLCACGMPELKQTTLGDLTYTLYGKTRVERITVTQNGKPVGTYKQKGMSATMLTDLAIDDYGFVLTDLNFDRKPDMRLAVAKKKAGMQYATYLWDEEQGEYVYHEALSALSDTGMIASLGVITAREYHYKVDPATDDTPELYIEKHSFVIYAWRDGVLTAIHRKELTYYEESDIYCYAILDLNDRGEWDTTRESWITADRFVSEKYPLDATGFEGYVAP